MEIKKLHFNAKDLIKQTFGDLTVISREGSSKDRQLIWNCKCSCGNEIKVKAGNLKSGNTVKQYF